MAIYEKLLNIQTELKSPKNQFNDFGKYKYRSCEDILESLKPLLFKYKVVIVLTDEIILIGNRYYIKATAKLTDSETGECIENNSLAREDETKKGQDLAQVTGSVSSYARKYALNGLFAIDDNKDSDSTNKHGRDNITKLEVENKWGKEITNAQLNKLYTLASKKGITKDTVNKTVMNQLKKDISKLSKEEYNIVYKGYDNLEVISN